MNNKVTRNATISEYIEKHSNSIKFKNDESSYVLDENCGIIFKLNSFTFKSNNNEENLTKHILTQDNLKAIDALIADTSKFKEVKKINPSKLNYDISNYPILYFRCYGIISSKLKMVCDFLHYDNCELYIKYENTNQRFIHIYNNLGDHALIYVTRSEKAVDRLYKNKVIQFNNIDVIEFVKTHKIFRYTSQKKLLRYAFREATEANIAKVYNHRAEYFVECSEIIYENDKEKIITKSKNGYNKIIEVKNGKKVECELEDSVFYKNFYKNNITLAQYNKILIKFLHASFEDDSFLKDGKVVSPDFCWYGYILKDFKNNELYELKEI